MSQKVIGIIGDGQLALMLADSLKYFKLPFYCLATGKDSPMMRTYPLETTLDPKFFQNACDVFTLENEFASVEELKSLVGTKHPHIFPNLPSYQHFADKISQRQLYSSLGIASPQWMALTDPKNCPLVLKNFSFPFVLKAAQGGYDGKGVRVIKDEQSFKKATEDFGLYQGRSLLVEEKVSIKSELAQGFLRGQNGAFTLLPLVDTVQEDGVCNLVYYPPLIDAKISSEIQCMLLKLIHYPLTGIFNFEFFVDDQNRVLINEGAPRPHNSQHLTINASDYSQFDLLALYLEGKKTLPGRVKTRPSAMINILGKSQSTQYELKLPQISSEVQVYPKLYAKEKSSPGRKMGHVNIIDESGKMDLRDIARRILKEYEI